MDEDFAFLARGQVIMPKQILDVKNKLFRSAKVILETEGYAALSMRRVAKECSIAVGTVYNYVQNKDELVAQIIMEDWVIALKRMAEAAEGSASAVDGMCGIYLALVAFVEQYQDVWAQYSQAGGSSGVIASHHMMLRGQIAEQIQRLYERLAQPRLVTLAPLLAETLLAAAMQPDMGEELVHTFVERLS